jgi:isoleucyl-tRNA synthetase
MVLDEAGKKMSKSLGNIVSPMTIIHGGKDKKKEPAYGADVLRLWVATVEYWRDMSIGPTVLAQCAESMRKIRNSARFILGNIGTIAERKHFVPVERNELGLAERFVMNELYKLDQIATEGYANYNFPKVMNSLTNFANITLSSLYFDITKDCLYANDIQSVERRAVVTTLAKVLDSMTSIMAPVLPYLAEEIHSTLHEGDETVSQVSVFAKKWTPVSAEWNDPHAEQDMASLLRMRSVVLSLLEKARGDKHLKSSLEAEVDIILPNDISVRPYLLQLIEREETFLKTLFIVSDANITDEGSLGTSSFAWSYVSSMDIPGSDLELAIRIKPASSSKCPRCWTYTREEEHDLCVRCEDVVRPAE